MSVSVVTGSHIISECCFYCVIVARANVQAAESGMRIMGQGGVAKHSVSSSALRAFLSHVQHSNDVCVSLDTLLVSSSLKLYGHVLRRCT